ncbi:hypothetical protein PAXRUDRAFT_30754 [Paxillus rubicundulus Ve08.2h10]|uniref:Uncharacterized protein n=1 Tax=Paxillus rubicundulus Ve08.2h10 TaxID=930991 RepID=A0A0D0E929_9AGAM|nr:hypothetical protein PAXRUDRAFT_30754 [Paxillus rubicundulus Ve08.2h10]
MTAILESLDHGIPRSHLIICQAIAWIGFSRQPNLPQCTDTTLLSSSHGPDTPPVPSMSSSYHMDNLCQEPDIPKGSMTADAGTHVFVSATAYLDGNLYVDPPDGVRRGSVRMKRVAFRRPVICSVDLPQLARRLSAQREAGQWRKIQRPSPSPVDDGWKEVKNSMLALDTDPSIDISFDQTNPEANGPSPCSTSELLDSPVLYKRRSPTMPQKLDVESEALPDCAFTLSLSP